LAAYVTRALPIIGRLSDFIQLQHTKDSSQTKFLFIRSCMFHIGNDGNPCRPPLALTVVFLHCGFSSNSFFLANVPIRGSRKMASLLIGGRAEIIGSRAGGGGWVLEGEYKRTMNEFAIDSLNELREDKLSPGYDKTEKAVHHKGRKATPASQSRARRGPR
jgi:hypothetical protein